MTTTIQELLDRNDIADLAASIGRAIDGARFDDLREVYTPDVVTTTPGGRAAGIDATVALAKRNHEIHDRTQHLVGDVRIDLDGDRAAVATNTLAVFVPRDEADPVLARGVRYRFDAVRTGAGWRFATVTIDAVWKRPI